MSVHRSHFESRAEVSQHGRQVRGQYVHWPSFKVNMYPLQILYLFSFLHYVHRNSSLLKRQVSKIVTGLSDIDKSQNRLIPFWYFVKGILNEPEIQRFDLLTNIKNDYGKGKAWLRASINERCLEKYMHLCINNEKLINQFYEKWAFMSNSEKNSILPNTAAGW